MKLHTDLNLKVSINTADLPWAASPVEGVDRKMLERNGEEIARATSLVRYASNASFSPHQHELGEEFLVLDGVFQDEHGQYPAGTYVKNPPGSYDELRAYVAKNPKSFGYNGLKNGMSGVAFVVGWMYAYGGNAGVVQQGPYDVKSQAGWKNAFSDLKAFNQQVVFTPGNAGTLDMLNRGEIAMGPVWVDMFHSWKAEGRLAPNLRLKILSPGMPGQPYYYAIPAKAKNIELAKKFIALATSPEVQAEGIVKRFNWYPGIDANVVKPALDAKTWNQLFVDVTPADLAKNGKPFPLAPFFKDMREQYEAQVQN